MTPLKRPVAVDIYCGVGGMALGFEQAGFKIAAAFDNDPIHATTFARNFPQTTVACVDLRVATGDDLRRMTRLQGTEIEAVFGGPPCQGFSLIGRRDPADPRNDLLIHFARIVGELHPKYFVLENVAGLLSGGARTVLASFLAAIREAGFSIILPMRILDAGDFGVPQRRRRLFVLGFRKGLQSPRYPESSEWVDGRPTVWDAIGDLPEVDEHGELLKADEWLGTLGNPSAYAAVLRGERPDPTDLGPPRPTNGRGLTGCRRTAHTAAIRERFGATPPGRQEAVSRFYRLAKDGVAPTIRAGTGVEHGSHMAPRPIHPTRARCITVREAARLQSFPDWFQFHSTKWHAFRQIGNSVAPFVARAVATEIVRAMELRPQVPAQEEEAPHVGSS